MLLLWRVMLILMALVVVVVVLLLMFVVLDVSYAFVEVFIFSWWLFSNLFYLNFGYVEKLIFCFFFLIVIS